MIETPNENLDYQCDYCGFKSKTSYQIWLHECDGKEKAKQFKKQSIKLGQQLGVAVGVSQ